MLSYIARRLGTGIVLAVLVSLITYLLLSTKIDSVMLSLVGSSGTAESAAALRGSLGYDRPVIVQYFDWLLGALRGDFGRSLFSAESVASEVIAHLSVTLSIIAVALFGTVVVSAVLGVWAASRGGLVDRVVQGVSIFGYVFPGLLLAIGLVYILAVQLRVLPATGFTAFGNDPAGWARSIAIPVIVLMVGGVATLVAQVRGAMLDELRKEYVRTLSTRGLRTRTIVLKYALRGAAGPALTVLSLEFIAMFGGALIIEKVFALPGFGSLAFEASLRGDIPLIMGITLFSVLLVIGVNLLADLLNGWLNPRARID